MKGKVSLPAPGSHTAFALVTKGGVVVNGAKSPAIALELVKTLESDGHVAVFLAPPLGEPIFAHGPFVMGSGRMGALKPTHPKRSKP